MHSALAERLVRRFVLRLGRAMSPERMLARGIKKALRSVERAARDSPAYRELLCEAGLRADGRIEPGAWASLPVLTKDTTFGRFALDRLSRQFDVDDLGDVLTSSGRGGRVFGFRLTDRKRLERSWFDIDLGLQDAFGVDDQATLLVNCLPMGVTFRSRAVTVANVSVREDMACAILRALGPRFKQTIVVTDPLFVRRLLAHAELMGLDWPALNTSFILGEEMLVEAQRDYIAAKVGIDLERDSTRMVASSFGVGELGLNLLFETRETIRLGRAMRRNPAIEKLIAGRITGGAKPLVFCYNPLRCHVEVLNSDVHGYGELCFTMHDDNAVIPLPRYVTGDCGRLVARADLCKAAVLAGVSPHWLPAIVMSGRLRDRPGGVLSVEDAKEILYTDHDVADRLTGAFVIDLCENVPRLRLQAIDEAQACSQPLIEEVTRLFQLGSGPGLRVEVLAPKEFPGVPPVDFERKFRYAQTSPQDV